MDACLGFLEINFIRKGKNKMKEEDYKSALTLYSIPYKEIFDLDYQEIWDQYVVSKTDDVSCRNVVHTIYSPAVLLEMFEKSKLTTDLLKVIKEEIKFGANVLFVKPIQGGPIGGFLTDQLDF
jgi:hypothetical protein